MSLIVQAISVPQYSIAFPPQAKHPSGIRDNWLQSSFFIHSHPPAAAKSETHLSQTSFSAPSSEESVEITNISA